MPNIANLVLKNGASTPVDKTFMVKLNDNRASLFEERSGGVPIGYPTIRVQTSDTKAVRKVTISIAIPTLEVPAPAANGFTPSTRVNRTHRSKHEFLLPQNGTDAERRDLLAFHLNVMGLAPIIAIVRDGDEYVG